MLLTIIIPVYNVERYVGRCLESVFTSGAADNAEVEVIVVNDGTPDGSMAVVEPYAAKHDNLIIINQANAGLSEARNAGLRIARGEQHLKISFKSNQEELYRQPNILP